MLHQKTGININVKRRKKVRFRGSLKTLLTSRVPAEEKFSDLIINKDEETIGESAEPPGWPVCKRREQRNET